jgi:hypothetical protein
VRLRIESPWILALLVGGVASCTTILGNDFEISAGSGGAGATGASAGAGATGGGTGGTGGGECPTGFVDCDGDPDNGCEANLDEDVDNCGACDFVCGTDNTTSVACVAGACEPECSTGFADCVQPQAPDADDGCELMLGTETDCGSCGHDCLGGACVDYACEPVVLASNAGGQGRELAIDDTNVYWTDRLAERVSKVPKDGGSPTVLHDSLRFGVITIDDTTVYWGGNPGDESLIGVVPIAGGSAENYAGPSTYVLGVNDTYLYFGDDPELWRMPKGGPFNTDEMAATGAGNMRGLFVDGTDIYFTSGTLIRHFDENTDALTLLYTSTNSSTFNQLTGDATNLYWTTGTNGELNQGPRAGGTYMTLAMGTNLANVAVNSTHVFATDQDGDAIIRVPIGGGTVETLIDTVDSPFDVQADETAIYFTSSLDGNVYKLALPPTP